jgi:dipeptidyl-peptidase 4
LIRQITSGKFDVAEFLGFDERNQFGFVAVYNPAIDVHGAKVNLKNGKMEVFTKTPGVHQLVQSEDKRYFMDAFSNLETPNQIDVYDATGKFHQTIFKAENP